MSGRGWTGYLRSGTALGFLVIATAQASAGGFGIREQSAYGQGTSFAGIAAGGALSSMFWNPATMTQVPGIQSESDVAGLLPYSAHNPGPGSALGAFGGTTNTAEGAFVPASYLSYQLNPNLWLGVSINAPFGLSVSFPDRWAGRDFAAGPTNLHTYNATPSIAYRINDWISVGAGVQIQYATEVLTQGLGATPGLQAVIKGNGWGYGFTAGATFTPTPTTTIGLGWRSYVDQKIDSTLSTSAVLPLTTIGSIDTTVKAPDTVSLGIRQGLGPLWTVMATAEWSNWSRIGTSVWTTPSGGAATIGGVPVTLPFQYKDGWFFSGGAEYKWTDRLTVRGGVGYELSPIDDRVRTPLIPDNDRFWASVGATWQVFKGLHFDLAYSHLWVKDPTVNISAGSGNPWFIPGATAPYVGTTNAHVDIFSGSLVFRWDEPAAAPATRLITK
ncbi:MAG TPA: OmpP1/FadL family transporter [Pseudolabrys sp.]|nr:OmpP1/FadL family transporter [Pseudolabrys sp.]